VRPANRRKDPRRRLHAFAVLGTLRADLGGAPVRSRFAAASADDAPQFVNPLARLALTASQLGEDRPFFVRQGLAHGGR
jgi:hypothetical protein